ncbi:MAG: DUF1015 domain-containing protein, partial [Nitrospirae bacterium]|nr:DUF1015 domain-containing protein [Nitrospirota bacterium]
MAKIAPLKGVLYNKERIRNVGLVATPPYDVITPEDQNRFYKKHKNNIIRLELGKQFSEDNISHSCYTRAAKFFEEWLDKGILLKEDIPSIYLYELIYPLNNEKKNLSGFICLASLDEGLMPHENTHKGPRDDRLNLLRACGASFSQIFGLYPDKENSIINRMDSFVKRLEPRIDIKDEAGIQHRIWQITDSAMIRYIIDAMNDKSLYIADGHHRYETALNYRNEMIKKYGKTTGKEAFNYIMVFLTSIEHHDLMLLPTHRLINYKKPINFAILEKNFKVDEFKIAGDEESARKRLLAEMKKVGEKGHAFGMLYPKNRSYYLLTLKSEAALDAYSDKTHSSAWNRLDVSILHRLIIENVFKIKNNSEGRIVYEQDDNIAAKRVL